MEGDSRVLDGHELGKKRKIFDEAGMLANLQGVLAGDVNEFLYPAVEIVNLACQVVYLGLGIHSHECS